jgi:hypothetical protein
MIFIIDNRMILKNLLEVIKINRAAVFRHLDTYDNVVIYMLMLESGNMYSFVSACAFRRLCVNSVLFNDRRRMNLMLVATSTCCVGS